jgi:hypothetical protein
MATLQDLANAMFGVEGSNPNLASNNNPGNLVYVGQAGATEGVGGFAAFATLADGIQAAINQIGLDLTRGTAGNGQPTTTLSELISNGWSPPSAPGNSQASTTNYINTVASQTGIDPNSSLISQLSDFRPVKGVQRVPRRLTHLT